MVTLKQIAQEAGVSITTVSNVISGRTNKVSPETIDKIKGLLKEYNYVPRFGLRALTNRKSGMIGVLINTPAFEQQSAYARPFYGQMIGKLEQLLREKGYYLMVCSSKDTQDITTMVLGWNVDGIIAISIPQKTYHEVEEATGKPIICIDMDVSHEEQADGSYNVTSKDYQAGCMMTKYLIGSGIRKMVFLANVKSGADYRRYRGARDTCRKEGITEELKLILLCRDVGERVKEYEQLRPLVGQDAALFFSTDLNAVEAINYYSQSGVRIPQDMSIVGCDDDVYATLCPCGLTTVHMDVAEKAEKAVHMLMELLDGIKVVEKNQWVNAELVSRGSVQGEKKDETI